MTDKQVPLSELPMGMSGVVREILLDGWRRRRLYDLGLLPGTEVRVVMRSALGDPIAYEIRGATYALRFEDAERILVSIEEGN